jgi:hypothetical protein
MTNTGPSTPVRRPGTTWSIGWLSGPSPFALTPDPGVRNPILTARDVTDTDAAFVADPFLFRHENRWHLVFEILEANTNRGVIGMATSADGRSWSYRGVILREPFHLSYPHVFAEGSDLYMTPETLDPARVRLYRAETLAGPWRLEAELIEGRWSDPTPFRYRERWWLFVCELNWRHDTLRLYHASSLTGPWREHPCTPVVAGDGRRARPAGRVVLWQGRPIRFAQDCVPNYGTAVRAFEILELTESTYVEQPATPEVILAAGAEPWMSGRVHHVDAQQVGPNHWVAAADGTTPLA